ncbi:integrase core domain protein [Trichuris suis]|nr:integrase core domain protein [Trichuris suis]
MNVIPDALSRAPVGPEVSEAEIVEEALLCTAVCDGVSREELEILQMADLELRRIRDWLDSGLVQTEEDKRKLNVQEEFRLVDGILYRKNHDQGRPWRLAIPLNLRRNIVVSTHAPPTAGHLGVEKTVNRLRKRYWWPNIMKTAREVVLACPICQKRKVGSGKPPGLLQSIELPSKPFEVLGIDHLGPFPLTGKGNRYIIVCIDYLTKWVELMAVADTTSQKVADFLMKSIVLRHGVPKKLISDQGTAFTAEKLKTTLGKLKIEHGMASSSHPQSNGLVERVNRTLSSILAAYVNSKHANWDDFVPYAMFAINTMDQSSTKLSPFELVYGRLAVLPTDSCFPWPEQAVETYDAFKRRVQNLRALARSRCMEAQKKQKILYDRGRKGNVSFRSGDLVLVRRVVRRVGRSAKLLPRFVGPFRVDQKVSPLTYRLSNLVHGRRDKRRKAFTAHIAQLKKYQGSMEPTRHRSRTSDQV